MRGETIKALADTRGQGFFIGVVDQPLGFGQRLFDLGTSPRPHRGGAVSAQQEVGQLGVDLVDAEDELLGRADRRHVQRDQRRGVLLQAMDVPSAHDAHGQQHEADGDARRRHADGKASAHGRTVRKGEVKTTFSLPSQRDDAQAAKRLMRPWLGPFAYL